MSGDYHAIAQMGGLSGGSMLGRAQPEQEQIVDRVKKTGGRYINCDQVAWLLDVFERYIPRRVAPGVSREREMLKYGALYEVMEVANLDFDSEAARYNGTPPDARKSLP